MPPESPSEILVPVSIGELIDKITILEIKLEHCSLSQKNNVYRELELLSRILARLELESNSDLVRSLIDVNRSLWEIEDCIREMERRQDFGDDFIKLARLVYLTNDNRAELKRKINVRYGSSIIEEKCYEPYARPDLIR